MRKKLYQSWPIVAYDERNKYDSKNIL